MSVPDALEDAHYNASLNTIARAQEEGAQEATLLMAGWPKHEAFVGRLCTRLRALGHDVRMLVDEGSDSESEGGIVVVKVFFE